MLITVCLLPYAYYRMLITVCLLPYAYYRMLITVCLLPYAAVSKRPAKETVITMMVIVCSRVQETCQRRIAKDVLPYLARPAPSVRPLCPPPLPVPPLHRCQEFDAKHTHTRAPARANPDGLCYHYDDV